MGIKSTGTNNAFWLVSGNGMTLKTVQDLKIGTRVDVDGNALIHLISKSGSGKGKSIGEIIDLMATKLKKLAHSGGFQVQVIMDGDIRPDTKRASIQRKKAQTLDEMNRVFCRMKTMEHTSKIQKITESSPDYADLKGKLDKYAAECKRLENKCAGYISIPSDFPERLSEKLMGLNACDVNGNGGFVYENIMKAKFQADSLIAKRALMNKNDLIYAMDGDFFCLIGEKCILLRNIKPTSQKRGRKRKSNDQNNTSDATMFSCELVGCSNSVMNDLKSKLEGISYYSSSDNTIQWREAEYPLFDEKCYILRAMMAIAIGCDVHPDGIPNFGAATAFKELCQIKALAKAEKQTTLANIQKRFLDLIVKRWKNVDSAIVTTLVSAYLCEPGLMHHETITSSSYLFEPPKSFPPYLKEFSCDEVPVNEAPDQSNQICCCKGFGSSSSHLFLRFEGENQCKKCNEIFCKYCCFNPKNEAEVMNNKSGKKIYYEDIDKESDEVYCLDCFQINHLGGASSQSSNHDIKNNISLNEMTRILNEKACLQIDSGATVSEIMDMFESYVSSPDSSMNSIHGPRAKSVEFPVLSTGSLKFASSSPLSLISKFKLSNGGSFISNKDIVTDQHIPSILELLSSIIETDEDKLVHKNRSDFGEYAHLPTMLLNFAYKSRVDSGYRLLDRCARHALDPKTESLLCQEVGIFEVERNGKDNCLDIIIDDENNTCSKTSKHFSTTR